MFDIGGRTLPTASIAGNLAHRELKRLWLSTAAIAFLGTPHAGTDVASWKGFLERWLRWGLCITRQPKATADDLESQAESLLALNTAFREHVQARHQQGAWPRVVAYRETQPLAAGVVVGEPHSADPGLAGAEVVDLAFDHIDICKICKLDSRDGAPVSYPRRIGEAPGRDLRIYALSRVSRPTWASAFGVGGRGLQHRVVAPWGQEVELEWPLGLIGAAAWQEGQVSISFNVDRFGLFIDIQLPTADQTFRWIEPGRFWMGADEQERNAIPEELRKYYATESPRHEVELSEGYWPADTPCTQGMWRYGPSAWGLYDMHGNVWEWCEGAQRTYTKALVVDPQDASDEAIRALRGGSWNDPPGDARSACRFGYLRVYRWDNVGFRLALRSTGPAGVGR